MVGDRLGAGGSIDLQVIRFQGGDLIPIDAGTIFWGSAIQVADGCLRKSVPAIMNKLEEDGMAGEHGVLPIISGGMET